jgi:hypothetical protein
MNKYTGVDDGVTEINKFLGLDNKNAHEALLDRGAGKSFLPEAVNVDISSTFAVSRRKGFSLASAGAYHSLWSNQSGTISFAVRDGQLVRISPDLSETVLGAMSERRLSYADTGAGIYLSDGQNVWSTDGSSIALVSRVGSYNWPSNLDVNPQDDEQALDAPPAGSQLAWLFGRLWVVVPEGVFYSRPYQPELFDLRKDYLDLPGISVIGAVDDGIFFGTGSGVYFLAGGNPNEPERFNQVSDCGAVAGTLLTTRGEIFKSANLAGTVVVWESTRGKIIGTKGGGIIETTGDHTSYPADGVGASMLRHLNGQSHIVSSLPNSGEVSNMRTSDIAVAEVRRNGIII